MKREKKLERKLRGKIAAAVVMLALIASCATGGGGSSSASSGRTIRGGNVPQFVRDAVKNASEDMLVGIGTARLATLSQSRTMSAARGRAEIARQLDTLIKDMIRDYQASSELDSKSALAFAETITVSLSQSRLQGASVVNEDMDKSGNYWTVVQMSKEDAAKEINQASAQAKLKVPAAASFDAEARMNAAFDAVKKDMQVMDK
ncbi:MAG: hypothetical protein LBT01_08695 [Spirochaetaceae bacterium]|jgi:hypothetical protein|nr:hypothetical protein [Spirochaetaceae bacterium]